MGGTERRRPAGPAPRAQQLEPERRRRPDDLTVVAVCVLLIALVALVSWVCYAVICERSPQAQATVSVADMAQAESLRHDSLAPTYTYDGEVIRWYVLQDPDFGIQYLVNDRGGCCVRLDSYGNVMGVSYEDAA